MKVLFLVGDGGGGKVVEKFFFAFVQFLSLDGNLFCRLGDDFA
jgi:hypothetical protein